MKKFSVFILISIIVVAAFYLIFFRTESFPKLPAGTYLGEVSGIFEDPQQSALILVESLPSKELVFCLSFDDWKMKRLPMVLQAGDEKKSVYPIVVSANEVSWKLTGKNEAIDGAWHGEIIEQGGGRKGNWHLRSVQHKNLPFLLDDGAMEKWGTLHNQISKSYKEIKSLQELVNDQTLEIEKLTSFITDEQKLKKRSEKKYRELVLKIDENLSELRKKESEARVYENQLALAQKVTDMGRLVLLARQTLEREGRWIASLSNTEFPFYDEDFELAVLNAKRIAEVKNAILEERQQIEYLKRKIQDPDAEIENPGYENQADSFDSLWGGN